MFLPDEEEVLRVFRLLNVRKCQIHPLLYYYEIAQLNIIAS